MTAGFITGLQAEARLLPKGTVFAVGGGTPQGAARAAEALIGQGATALISFGLAGGLEPGLLPGTIIIPGAVLVAGQRYAADAALSRRLGGVTHAALVQTPAILATVAEKQAAHAASGAVAVDLESGAVAEAATRHGLPFAVLRAICDPAGRDLPPAALAALDHAGAIGLLRVLASLARNPSQLGGLLGLAGDAARARRALTRHLARNPLQPAGAML